MSKIAETLTTKRGGTRHGAGRPTSPGTIAVPVRLTPVQAETLRRMGVAKWLRPLLDSLK